MYVGSSVKLSRRWRIHLSALRNGKHHSQKLQRAWDKYGESQFEFAVIEAVPDISQILHREQFWIDFSGAFGPDGYNLCPLARSVIGLKHSEEQRLAKSKRTLGKKYRKHTPEMNAAKSLRQIGWKKPPLTDEQRRNVAAAQIGKKASSETRAKMSASHKGKPKSPEHVAAFKAAWIVRKAKAGQAYAS
jgi:group I intron endonuclease